jgi:chromosome segregation ATPase
LDNDAILKQFEEIEQKVDKLIEVCKSFEETKLELTNKIERLEKELQGKVEEESRYAEGKALIRSKVDSLLARLEDVTEG